MAMKPNKAFTKIGCGLTPLSSPNCIYYQEGDLFSHPTDVPGERDRHFCKHFDKRTIGCTCVGAAAAAMIAELARLGVAVKPDDSKFKEEKKEGAVA